MPLKHASDIQPEHKVIIGHMYWVTAQLAAEQDFADEGYRTVMNCNQYGGQTLYHIHLHVLADQPVAWHLIRIP